jgi:hypothetical protein
MKKIWNWFIKVLNGIGIDKWYHFIAGLIIASFFNITLGMEVCIVPVIFVAFIKEFIDQWVGGKFDWRDFAWTCAGGAVIQLFVIL